MNIAVVGPHPDDQELGMGGTIARLVQQGHRVTLIDLTNGEPTPYGSPEIRQQEAPAAARVLGAERIGLGLPNRRLEATLAARDLLAGAFRTLRPEIVFGPFHEDAHPDHVAAAQLVDDARFTAKLTKSDLPGEPWHPQWVFQYFCVHLRAVPRPAFILDTTGASQLKSQAILEYKSQFVTPPSNRHIPEWIAAADIYFGSRIGTQAGEPFACREEIGMRDLGALTRLG